MPLSKAAEIYHHLPHLDSYGCRQCQAANSIHTLHLTFIAPMPVPLLLLLFSALFILIRSFVHPLFSSSLHHCADHCSLPLFTSTYTKPYPTPSFIDSFLELDIEISSFLSHHTDFPNQLLRMVSSNFLKTKYETTGILTLSFVAICNINTLSRAILYRYTPETTI